MLRVQIEDDNNGKLESQNPFLISLFLFVSIVSGRYPKTDLSDGWVV